MSGVPLGTDVPVLLATSSGLPSAITRVAPLVNCAVTHGGAPVVIVGNWQAATVYCVVSTTTGLPPISTRGTGVTGVPFPRCAHCTGDEMVRTGPGMVVSYCTVSAPLLMVISGPTSFIDAPLPLSM